MIRQRRTLHRLLPLLASSSILFILPATGQGKSAQVATAQPAVIPEWQKVAGGRMSFDVASIRLSKPDEVIPPNIGLGSEDNYAPLGGLFTTDYPLIMYIKFAYRLSLTPEQAQSMVAHLPKWVATDRYEIRARASGNPTKDQMRLMMQSLLADRFKLAVHLETQQIPAFALTLIKPGKTGPKLRPHADGPACDVSVVASANGPTAESLPVFPSVCNAYQALVTSNHTLLEGSRNTTMELLATSLSSVSGLGRPLFDQTALTGRFDFALEWTPEPGGFTLPGATIATSDSPGTTFVAALREQLGLKLESTKWPTEVLVVDQVDKPSEN